MENHDHHKHNPKHHSESEDERILDEAAEIDNEAVEKEQMHEHHDHGGHANHHEMMVKDFKKRFWISLVITIPVLLLSPLIQEVLNLRDSLRFSGDIFVLFGLSTIVFFYGGYPFLKGFFDEMKKFKPGMMTLIALAISVAYFYSSAVVFGLRGTVFFWELVTLIDIMLLGHWIEMRSVMGASRALEELAKLMPDEAHLVLENGDTKEVAVKDLKHKDIILIKPGEKIPADGLVVEGRTSINEAMVTGESKPVTKEKDDEVIGGSINGEGSIKVSVEKTGDETFLSQVIELVKKAQDSKSKTQNLANKAALWLTLVAIIGGAITMFIWSSVLGMSFNFALTRTVTVMVIACPHALGLAIPLVVAVSTALSAKNGLLIRDRNAFENARNIQAIIFDKTGTLTKGEFGVTETISFTGMEEKEILKYAAAVESNSEHPIARGILTSTEEKYDLKEFNSIPGKGAEGIVNGRNVKVVSPGFLKENNIKIEKGTEKIDELSGQGKTVVFLIINDKLTGAIALADIIREDSKQAIKELKAMGIKPMMLTGDNKQVAAWVAKELDLDDYFAEVLPDKKADKIIEVQKRGLVVAMTGDGVNDAPALAQADVGIAIGAGTDVAVETADIILVNSNPLDAVKIVKFARATYKKMIQNLIWATGYNVIAIPLAAGVLYSLGILLTPAMGAVLMSASTVIVSINARMLKV